jgi:hypothetical protein
LWLGLEELTESAWYSSKLSRQVSTSAGAAMALRIPDAGGLNNPNLASAGASRSEPRWPSQGPYIHARQLEVEHSPGNPARITAAPPARPSPRPRGLLRGMAAPSSWDPVSSGAIAASWQGRRKSLVGGGGGGGREWRQQEGIIFRLSFFFLCSVVLKIRDGG